MLKYYQYMSNHFSLKSNTIFVCFRQPCYITLFLMRVLVYLAFSYIDNQLHHMVKGDLLNTQNQMSMHAPNFYKLLSYQRCHGHVEVKRLQYQHIQLFV